MGEQFAEHPDVGQLNDFLLGRLDEKSAQQVERHLDTCPECCLQLEKIEPNDAFLGLVLSSEHISSASLLADSKELASSQPKQFKTEISSSGAGYENEDGSGKYSTVSDGTSETTIKKEHQRNRGNRYEIRSLLGEGGLGSVWLAFDRDLNREVALKEVQGKLEGYGRELDQRLIKEAQIAGQLDHPSIVPVYELVQGDEQQIFYTMRVVRGQTLREAVEALPEKPSEAERHRLLTAFVNVCQAVGYANDKQVIHRDLKPDNVILGDYGEVQIVDWGLARVLGSENEKQSVHISGAASELHTVHGSVMGTPAFM